MSSTIHTSSRSIDDFLQQLHGEFKRRLTLFSLNGFRVSFPPIPILALCIANCSDATEILMLSYLLANPTFRRDMLSNGPDDGLGGDTESDTDDDMATSMQGAEYLAASIFLGMLIGGTILGFLSDQLGRRPTLLVGLGINASAGLLSSLPFLTPTISPLKMLRFIAGIGIGATIPSLFSLASEWSPKEVRGTVVTLVASFWMVGSLYVSLVAWILFRKEDLELNDDQEYTDSGVVEKMGAFHMWRIFAAVCSFPSAAGAIMVYLYVPESPRFLASHLHKYEESAFVCNRMAALLGVVLMNEGITESSSTTRENHPLMEETSCKSTDSLTGHGIYPLTGWELKIYDNFDLSNYSNGANDSIPFAMKTYQILRAILQTTRKLYSPPLLTRTTLPLQVTWFFLSFSTYGISTWINTLFHAIKLQNIYFNSFLFALANLPGNIVSILYSDKLGRKRLLTGSLICAAGGLMGFVILLRSGDDADKLKENGGHKSTSLTYGIVSSACIFQMFSIISWNTIDIITGELFPTSARSAGMGVCTACGRFGAMFAQFVFARLMANGNSEGEVASVHVLLIATTALLIGAVMPLMLERDMTLGQLKDEVVPIMMLERDMTLGQPKNEICTQKFEKKHDAIGCINNKFRKDHLSDDEADSSTEQQRQFVNEFIQKQAKNMSLYDKEFLL